jgi:hypothetical protein
MFGVGLTTMELVVAMLVLEEDWWVWDEDDAFLLLLPLGVALDLPNREGGGITTR